MRRTVVTLNLTSPCCRCGVFAPALVSLLIATASGANEWISDISPDGRFAVHRTRDAAGMNDERELIALPARSIVMQLANGAGGLVWGTDSRRFARAIEQGVHNITVAIYERAGKSFELVGRIEDFPDSRSAYKGWPNGWRETGRDHQEIHPVRWLDRGTLLVGVHHSVRVEKKGEESNFWQLDAQFTVKPGSKERSARSALTILRRDFVLESKPPPPKLISDHIAEPLDWQVSADKSVVLVEAKDLLDLIVQHRDEPARVTHLHQQIEQLFLPDFRDCGAAPLNAEKPFSFAGDWFLHGAERVVIHCEATTNPDGNQRSKMWCARLDAVWSIKEAKFTQQKIVRGFCGKLREDDSFKVVARSPSSAFRIELREQLDTNQRATAEYQSFVVPEKADESAGVPLGQKIPAGDVPSLTCQISPDERSIYMEWGSGGERRCAVFAQTEGLRFVNAVPGPDNASFDQAMWDFCRKTASLEPTTRRQCTFVAWALDSSRVLISLRVSMKGLERDWKVYWNTRTRTFELTPLLTELNERASESSRDMTFEPFCAEPAGPLPSLEELDRLVATARAAFQENWMGNAAHEKKRAERSTAGTWPAIEKKAENWRTESIADIEKFAGEFSRRWPDAEREQWRRLSLAGGFRALGERIGREWPWQQ